LTKPAQKFLLSANISSKALHCGVDFMPVLRINQQRGDAPHRYRIEITATDIPNFAPQQFSETSPLNSRRRMASASAGILRTISNSTKPRRRKSPKVLKP
jgi:hypothetical protein